MLSDKIEKQILYIFLLAVFVLQIVLMFLNERVFEGTDNVTHFHIARYAFKYPHLFLDSWGKPVYTTLSAPFALFGFKMAQVFNLLVATFTLVFVYKIGKKIFPEGAIFAVALAAFAPIYFFLMITCLTEILFSFVLLVAVYLFMKNKLMFSAIVLSFIPFVRNEGIIILSLFALAFVLKRSWIPVFLLGFGTLFYSFVGFFALGDFFWIVNRFAYPTGESVYGNGDLFHFVEKSNFIFGVPLIIVMLIGLFSWIKDIIQKFSFRSEYVILFILIVGSWLGYFAAHSFVWWKGMGGSLGLVRVIGAVIPLAALTGLRGMQFLYKNIKNKKVVFGVLILVVAAQIYMFFDQAHLPSKKGSVEKLIAKSASFVKSEFTEKKIFYFNPDFVFLLNLNPYDQSKSNWGIGDKMKPSNSMEFGDVLIWDAHFGPNEGRVNLETLQNDVHMEMVKSFFPVDKITVLGGYDYAIHIFKKVKTKMEGAKSAVFKRALEINPKTSKQVIEVEGNAVFELQKGNKYSPNIVIYKEELLQKELFETMLTIQYKSENVLQKGDVSLVISVENGKEVLKYEAKALEWDGENKEWQTSTVLTRFSADIPESAKIKMYVWNRNLQHLYIKNLEANITSY